MITHPSPLQASEELCERANSHPDAARCLHQINTRVSLRDLAQNLRRSATLDEFPDFELDRLPEIGSTVFWLLEVCQPGDAARKISRENPNG